MSLANADGSRPTKRNRIAESCKLCRAKKTRCDGQRPTCSPCLVKHLTCEYNESNTPLSSDVLSKLADLEARVQRLEHQATAPHSGPAIALTSEESISHSPSRNTRTTERRGHGQSLAYADNPTTRFISSVTRGSTPQQSEPMLGSDARRNHVASPIETYISEDLLPPREAADDLVDCYERFVYPMFPVLHMPSFRKEYLCFWRSQVSSASIAQTSDPTFQATMNIVFALGCLNSSRIEPSLTLQTARNFYHRARKIMPLDLLDNPSLEVVQYLLLTGNYLSFTKYSHRYCNTMAVALRVAQTVGLHIDQESSPATQLGREMGRRVWHLCLTMERLMSTLFGWNTIITHKNKCSPPQIIDDEYLLEEGEGCQPPGKPSLLHAFAISIDIFAIITEAQDVNFTTFTGPLRTTELTKVLQLNDNLNKIEFGLPKHLKYDLYSGQDTSRDQVLRLQAEVVNIRILYLRLLLLRPNLLATARELLTVKDPNLSTTGIETTLRFEISTICVQTALTAINLLHTNLQSSSKIISANALFVTLSAATVLIASSVVPGLSGDLDDHASPYGRAVAKAFEIFDAHEWRVEGASETRTKLRQFLDTVKSTSNRQRDGNRGDNAMENQNTDELFFAGQGDIFDNINLSDALWVPQLDGMMYF